MRRVLESELTPEVDEPCPALFRYLAGALPDTDGGGAVLSGVHGAELELLRIGILELPGRFLVARRD